LPDNPKRFDHHTVSLRAQFTPDGATPSPTNSTALASPNQVMIPAALVPEGTSAPGYPFEHIAQARFTPDQDDISNSTGTNSPQPRSGEAAYRHAARYAQRAAQSATICRNGSECTVVRRASRQRCKQRDRSACSNAQAIGAKCSGQLQRRRPTTVPRQFSRHDRCSRSRLTTGRPLSVCRYGLPHPPPTHVATFRGVHTSSPVYVGSVGFPLPSLMSFKKYIVL
jgi:hypothetical protein